MACLLIKKADPPHWATMLVSNPEGAERGVYRKGDVVCVYPDSKCPLPPSPNSTHVLVIVDGVTREQAQGYMDDWKREIVYQEISHDTVTGEYVYQVSALEQSVCHLEYLTKAKVESWLEKHNGTVLSFGTNWVRFSFTPTPEYTRPELLQDCTKALRVTVKRRKWRMPDNIVDWVISQGGRVEVTKQQALTYLKSKFETADGY